MISIVLPYWDRQEAANHALALLSQHYAGLDLEVIVVDDGNAVPFVVPEVALNVRVLYLPKKDGPKSSCVPFNEGVKAAAGEVIVLSSIEILHEKPVLPQMIEQLEALGDSGYVLAAAWCPEENKWHTHSSVKVPLNPAGTGLHFCAMLRKDFYLAAGGIDNDYRDGAGFEDNDWINRLIKAGAEFCIRDDLVVVHPKTGARTNWPDGAFDRNERLYHEKWGAPKPPSIAVVCVEVGDYCGRGERYVRTLKAMVARHLTLPHTFYCITDTPKAGIECIEAHDRLPGWWQKLYQFKEGLFSEEKIVFFDLDTFIVGNIDKIAALDTDLAMIRDFWQPQRAQSGVMVWRNGGLAHLFWDHYEAQGFPTDHPEGDGGWMGDQPMPAMNFHMLQDVFPLQIVSYKTECMKLGRDRLKAPPLGARVMCFHGDPRPHSADGWARSVWSTHKPAGASERIEVAA